jgi:hypothetical protein
MEVEQRYDIRFFSDHGGKILGGSPLSVSGLVLDKASAAGADLADVASLGGAPDNNLTTDIADKIESDPHLSARFLAYSIIYEHWRVHNEP